MKRRPSDAGGCVCWDTSTPTSASFISSASNKPDEADRRQSLSHREWVGPGGFAGSTAATAHLER
jgi:hypothetical protein